MRTVVPPTPGPLFGVIVDTLGGGTAYVTAPLSVADCPSGFVPVTSAGPTPPGGAAPSTRLGFTCVAPATGDSPTNASAFDAKFDPLICTGVPPNVDTFCGLTLATAGGCPSALGSMYANAFTF